LFYGKQSVEKLMSVLLKVVTSVWFVCFTGCETWTSEESVASLDATLYTSLTLSQCLKLCLEMSSCVAVDYSVVVCGVHTNINDTFATFSAPGFTQYTLNRACQTSALTSALSTSSTAGTETSTLSTYYGECHTEHKCFNIW